MSTPTIGRLYRVRRTIIPHRIQAIEAGQAALEWQQRHDPYSATISIQVVGSQDNLFDGNLIDITDPMIFKANVSCRLLLNFLGIGIKARPLELVTITKSRQATDVGIEHYSDPKGAPLPRLTPDAARALFPDHDAACLLSSWATVIAITNKRLSHLTENSSPREQDADAAMQVAFETIPELVRSAFLDRVAG